MSCSYVEYPEQRLVEITVDGKVTEADFDRIASQLEAFIQSHGKVKVLEIIHHFTGVELATLAKGIRFDMQHIKHFSHCAVVTDSGWIGPFARMMAPFFSIELRTFPVARIEEARAWLKAA